VYRDEKVPNNPDPVEGFLATAAEQKKFYSAAELAVVGRLEETEGRVPTLDELKQFGQPSVSGDLDSGVITSDVLWRGKQILQLVEKCGPNWECECGPTQWLNGAKLWGSEELSCR
jgi:hypothetical protein